MLLAYTQFTILFLYILKFVQDLYITFIFFIRFCSYFETSQRVNFVESPLQYFYELILYNLDLSLNG